MLSQGRLPATRPATGAARRPKVPKTATNPTVMAPVRASARTTAPSRSVTGGLLPVADHEQRQVRGEQGEPARVDRGQHPDRQGQRVRCSATRVSLGPAPPERVSGERRDWRQAGRYSGAATARTTAPTYIAVDTLVASASAVSTIVPIALAGWVTHEFSDTTVARTRCRLPVQQRHVRGVGGAVHGVADDVRRDDAGDAGEEPHGGHRQPLQDPHERAVGAMPEPPARATASPPSRPPTRARRRRRPDRRSPPPSEPRRPSRPGGPA